MKLKRIPLDGRKKKQRENIFKIFSHLTPLEPVQKLIFPLEKGNSKTGTAGKFFDIVYVWNLPPCVTCPGATLWCESHCYNLDLRKDVYDIERWRTNWWYAIYNIPELETNIMNQLVQNKNKKVAVRLHSSGDFFSRDYINMWIRISKKLQFVYFWGYTRSWSEHELSNAIYELSNLENVNLYASIDATTNSTPKLKTSITVDTTQEIAAYKYNPDYIICPEQFNTVLSCADCSICINKSNKNIVFISH